MRSKRVEILVDPTTILTPPLRRAAMLCFDVHSHLYGVWQDSAIGILGKNLPHTFSLLSTKNYVTKL